MTGKQKRHLRSLAHSLKPVLNIGKLGISPEFLNQVQECLLQHELIKIKVLESSPLNTKESSKVLKEQDYFEIIQKIGHTLVLYAEHPEDPTIVLP